MGVIRIRLPPFIEHDGAPMDNKKHGLAVLITASLLSAPSAFAWPVNISVGGSTLGLGVQVATAIIPGTLDAAVGLNHAGFTKNGTYTNGGDDIPYTGSLRLQSIPVLLDYYPFHGVFRITGGVMVNQNAVNADASGGSGTYTINGNTYTAQQVGTLTAHIGWRRIAPYLGIGWGSKAARHAGFSMGFDIGALVTGSPHVTLTASNPTDNTQLASDVAAAQAKANNQASSYRFWPVIGLRVGYAF